MAKSQLADDLLWGVAEIARHLRRSERQCYYLISRGQLPATKLGPRTIVARRSELASALAALTQAAPHNGDAKMRDCKGEQGGDDA
jgi:hypothetical protein